MFQKLSNLTIQINHEKLYILEFITRTTVSIYFTEPNQPQFTYMHIIIYYYVYMFRFKQTKIIEIDNMVMWTITYFVSHLNSLLTPIKYKIVWKNTNEINICLGNTQLNNVAWWTEPTP